MNTIQPDGITKEFKLSAMSGKVYQVLIYDGENWNEASFTFNGFKNSVIFDKAPAKGSIIQIAFSKIHSGLEYHE